MNLKNITLVILAATIATNSFGTFTSTLADAFQAKIHENFEKEKHLYPNTTDMKAAEELAHKSLENMVALYAIFSEEFKFQDNSLAEYEKEICEASVHMLQEATENAADSLVEKTKDFALHAQKNGEISRLGLLGFLQLSLSMAMNLAIPETYSKAQFLTIQKVTQMFNEKLNEFIIQEFGDLIEGLQKETEATA